MSKEKRMKEEVFFQAFIGFPNVSKKAKDREMLFNETYRLIDKNKESFPAKLVLKKVKRKIILDSDDYMFTIDFKRRLVTRIMVNNPDENMEVINKIGNSVINFLNTILGEQAKGSRVSITKICFSKKEVTLPSKIIGTAQLAKVNEIAKETLNPVAITFEYIKSNTNFMVSSISSTIMKLRQNVFSSQTIFEEKLPFDLLQKENEKLNEATQLFVRLVNAEL